MGSTRTTDWKTSGFFAPIATHKQIPTRVGIQITPGLHVPVDLGKGTHPNIAEIVVTKKQFVPGLEEKSRNALPKKSCWYYWKNIPIVPWVGCMVLVITLFVNG